MMVSIEGKKFHNLQVKSVSVLEKGGALQRGSHIWNIYVKQNVSICHWVGTFETCTYLDLCVWSIVNLD